MGRGVPTADTSTGREDSGILIICSGSAPVPARWGEETEWVAGGGGDTTRFPSTRFLRKFSFSLLDCLLASPHHRASGAPPQVSLPWNLRHLKGVVNST